MRSLNFCFWLSCWVTYTHLWSLTLLALCHSHIWKEGFLTPLQYMKLSQQLRLVHLDAVLDKVVRYSTVHSVLLLFTALEFNHCQYDTRGQNLHQTINSKITKYFPLYVLENLSYAREWKYFFFLQSEIIFRNCLIIKASQKRTKNCYQGSTTVEGLSKFPGVWVPLHLSDAATELLRKCTQVISFFRPIFFCL